MLQKDALRWVIDKKKGGAASLRLGCVGEELDVGAGALGFECVRGLLGAGGFVAL